MSYKKYYVYKQQYSEDGGRTWKDTDPLVTSPSGDPIGEYATLEECQGLTPEPQYRWVNMDVSVDYYCEGTTKYYKQKKQVSYDSGATWTDVVPAEYQKSGVAETESTDCGYVPPTPTGTKFVANYSDGKTLEVECNDSSKLTKGETKPSGYVASEMTSAVIGSCVTSIGNEAFYHCSSLTSINIPNSVTSIGESAFQNCSGLISVTIPNSVTTIGGWTFNGCISLVTITIPNSVTSISSGVFQACESITSIIIPNGVTTIGNMAFYHCSSLTSVTISSSVTSIGNQGFQYCRSLTSVTCLATTPPTLTFYVFDDTNDCPIYVPASSVDAYKSASKWSRYASRIQPIS